MIRTATQKIVFGCAIAMLVGALASLVGFVGLLLERNIRDVLTVSFMAMTIFLVCCAIVLFFMSKPPRYELRPWDGEPDGNKPVVRPDSCKF
ncbi:MAG: hypothetical protein WC091_22135 [Sulfuricellaceae bacterium]